MVNLIFPEINLDQVKGVLLDLDNTLYHYEPCHKQALNTCFKSYDWPIDYDSFKKMYRKKRLDVTQRLTPSGACRSRLFAFQALIEELNIQRNFTLALDMDTIYWKTFLNSMLIDPGASELIRLAKKQHIKLCVVTDMLASIQIQKLAKLNLDSTIDYLVTSEEIGQEKPSPKMFTAALKKLKLQPKDVIMIGDSYDKDISGAEAIGIKGYKVGVPE